MSKQLEFKFEYAASHYQHPTPKLAYPTMKRVIFRYKGEYQRMFSWYNHTDLPRRKPATPKLPVDHAAKFLNALKGKV